MSPEDNEAMFEGEDVSLGLDGSLSGPAEGVIIAEDDEDNDASTVVPYEEVRELSATTMCLVPLTKKSERGEGLCCPNSADCGTRGHRKKKSEGRARSGKYRVTMAADGSRIERVFREGFRSTAEMQQQSERDEAKLASLSAERTPQQSRQAQAAATKKTRNAALPRTIFTPRPDPQEAAAREEGVLKVRREITAAMHAAVAGLPPKLQEVARDELGEAFMAEIAVDPSEEGSQDTGSTRSLLQQLVETANKGDRAAKVERLEQEVRSARQASARNLAGDSSESGEARGLGRARFSDPPISPISGESTGDQRRHYLALGGLQPLGVYDSKRAAQAKA